MDTDTDATNTYAHALHSQLAQRVNAGTESRHMINQLYAVHQRCATSTRQLRRMLGQAPRISRVIRLALRHAFALDPDGLLFTEPGQVNTLTERALALLVDPFVPANINQFTTLSLRGAPLEKLAFTPFQVLERVKTLKLLERLDHAKQAYWARLADASWLTRSERWVQLYRQWFADQAFVAHQLDELSDKGFAMICHVVDAPSAEARRMAGGAWAGVHVSPLSWPGNYSTPMAIPGALLMYRNDPVGETLQVVYLPGLARRFFEYPTWTHLQCGLTDLLKGDPFNALWQCLPLRRRHEVSAAASAPWTCAPPLAGDALAYSAVTALDGQWDNELACALSINHVTVAVPGQPPPQAKRLLAHIEKARTLWVGVAPLASAVERMLKWGRQRCDAQIVASGFTSGLAIRSREAAIRRHENGLLALLDSTDLSKDVEAYQAFVALQAQWQAQVSVVQANTQGSQTQLLGTAFWLESDDTHLKRATRILNARRQALLDEAELQQRLRLMGQGHRKCLSEVLEKPLASQRAGSDSCVLSLSVQGDGGPAHALLDVFAATTVKALTHPHRRQPVVLVVGGSHGTVMAFDSLAALTQSVQDTLQGPGVAPLWRSIARDQRSAALQALLGSTAQVTYARQEGDILREALQAQVKHHVRLAHKIDTKVQLFSEISDTGLARQLLAEELQQALQVPRNETRSLALGSIEQLRLCATQAKKFPSWLARATPTQLQRYRQMLKRYVGSTLAVEDKLWRVLPALETYARQVLIARLTEDGLYPQLDIDMPLLDLPDNVGKSFCAYSSACAPGDRHAKTQVSEQRTTYSLLQLTLHNLDPHAPWTEWRLNRARYLDPTWKAQLNVQYLIKTLSALDIGGRYELMITQAFYPVGLADGLEPALMHRAITHGARLHLYSALQAGLSARAQSIFKTAMAARVAQDLHTNGHDLQLCFVRLRAITLAQPRHIAGMLVFHDRISQVCVVYWPDAQASPIIAEYPDWNTARNELNRLGTLPENVQALASQVASGWEDQALASYPGASPGSGPKASMLWHPLKLPAWHVLTVLEAIDRFIGSFDIRHHVPADHQKEIEAQIREQIQKLPPGWLDLVVAPHSHACALLAHARMLQVQRHGRARANSAERLAVYRELRLGEQRDASLRGALSFVLSFVPGVGSVFSVFELLLAARKYHLSGDPHDLVDVVFFTVLAGVDVMTDFAPCCAIGASATGTGVARSIARNALGRLHRPHSTGPMLSTLQSASFQPLKALERFKQEGIPAGAIALRGPADQGSYVKHGQQFIVAGGDHYPVYRRAGEEVLRVKNQQQPSQDELILNIHQPREWLLGADAPQPVAGTLAASLNPLPTRASPPPDWWPPVVRKATEERILQSSNPSTRWLDWRMQIPIDQRLSSPAPGVFHVPVDDAGFSYNVLRVAPPYATLNDPSSGYYKLLPQGDQAPLNRIVFVAKDERLVSIARVDIERWTDADLHEQPIPVSRTTTGGWQLHARLFEKPLPDYLATAFPTMTRKSREFAAARIIELAGPRRPATATHLLNIRTALDDWLSAPPAKPGQTDDLLRMLRPIELGAHSTFISYQDVTPGFTRVDFVPPAKLERRLHLGGKAVAQDRDVAQRAAVKSVLEQQGFTLQDFQVTRYGIRTHESVATHFASPGRLYYLAYQWIEQGHFGSRTKFKPKWFDALAKSSATLALSAEIKTALQEQRLVSILAGVQWPIAGYVPPTVYFVKLTRGP